MRVFFKKLLSILLLSMFGFMSLPSYAKTESVAQAAGAKGKEPNVSTDKPKKERRTDVTYRR